jgi:hypothetical protein
MMLNRAKTHYKIRGLSLQAREAELAQANANMLLLLCYIQGADQVAEWDTRIADRERSRISIDVHSTFAKHETLVHQRMPRKVAKNPRGNECCC